jgi:hypothetical protein
LERTLVFLQSKLESAWEYGDKASEKRIAEAIEQTLLDLDAIRSIPYVAPREVAKRELPDPLAGFGSDRRRGADALLSVLTAPSTDLKKAAEEAAAVEKLDQSLGVNGIKPVKSATKMAL